jgi:hypothetical protein
MTTCLIASEKYESKYERHKRMTNNLFARGQDTLQIAETLGRSEPWVLRVLTIARDERRGDCTQFERAQ